MLIVSFPLNNPPKTLPTCMRQLPYLLTMMMIPAVSCGAAVVLWFLFVSYGAFPNKNWIWRGRWPLRYWHCLLSNIIPLCTRARRLSPTNTPPLNRCAFLLICIALEQGAPLPWFGKRLKPQQPSLPCPSSIVNLHSVPRASQGPL